MILNANAAQVFRVNIGRTNMLLDAVEKLKGYNWLSEQRLAETEPQLLTTMTQVHNAQLEAIGRACAEHAIISLATVFETYYSELLQELLFTNPNYFTSQPRHDINKIHELVSDTKLYTHEDIEKKLALKGRMDYYRFFEIYKIPFFRDSKQLELIDYIYAWRNHFVHNANRPDPTRDRQLGRIKPPVSETSVVTEAKRLRTRVTKLIPEIDSRVKAVVYR